jgi:hypothetical protein
MAIQGLDRQAGTPDNFDVETMIVAARIQGCSRKSLFFDQYRQRFRADSPGKR